MIKKSIGNAKKKNKIINKIINAMTTRKSFLLCGHKDPDEDCISSLIAFAILLTKFDKHTQIYIKDRVPGNIKYLLNICKYNSITVVKSRNKIKTPDTIVSNKLLTARLI